MQVTKIKIETTVKAGISQVWEYWNSPEHIKNWNFADDDWHCPKAENDLKVNGKFKYTMASKDGKFQFDFEGVYNEIEHERKIAYTLSDGRKVQITFEASENSVKITETFEPENINSIEMQKTGWQAILNNFKKEVERNAN